MSNKSSYILKQTCSVSCRLMEVCIITFSWTPDIEGLTQYWVSEGPWATSQLWKFVVIFSKNCVNEGHPKNAPKVENIWGSNKAKCYKILKTSYAQRQDSDFCTTKIFQHQQNLSTAVIGKNQAFLLWVRIRRK